MNSALDGDLYKINPDYTTPEYIIPDVADPNIDLPSHANDTHEGIADKHSFPTDIWGSSLEIDNKPLSIDDLISEGLLASQSTEADAPLDNMGQVDFTFMNKEGKCKFVPEQDYYHLRSFTKANDGMFSIESHYKEIPDFIDGTYFQRTIMMYKDSQYQHYPINMVCPIHQQTFKDSPSEDSEDKSHIIQGLPNCEVDRIHYLRCGTRNSLVYLTGKPDSEGNISAAPKLISLCNATCVSAGVTGHKKEALYDLLLVQTLEVFRDSEMKVEVLARRSHNIWPKSNICARDIEKAARRLPKGGATKQAKRPKIKEEVATLEMPVVTMTDIDTLHFEGLIQGIKEGRLTKDIILSELSRRSGTSFS